MSDSARMLPLFVALGVLSLASLAPQVAWAAPGDIGSRPSRIVVRPGSAAAPFGPATVVADFDADGAPDVAIADRVDHAGGTRYRLEVQLSGGATQYVSFVSTDGAVNVIAVDVDDDHDADLVITPVLSRQVVAVWLNDGAGHFNRGDPLVLPPLPAAWNGSHLSGLPNRDAALPTSPRRSGDAATSRNTVAFWRETSALPRLDVVVSPRAAIVAPTSPRAPPLVTR